MISRVTDFLQNQGRLPSLTRWAVALTFGHVLFFIGLVLTGAAESWVLIQDSLEYLKLAAYPLTDGIYSLDGLQSSGKREPGYSGFMMMFMAAGIVKPHVFTLANLWPIVIVQIGLYGWISGKIARSLVPVFGGAAAWLGLMLMQVTQLASYQYSLGNECFSIVLMGMVMLEISSHWRQGPSWGVLLRTACWLGLLAITKSVNVLFIPVLSFWLWLRLPVRLPKMIVFFTVALLPALSWTARNKEVFGLPIMGSIDGFSSLYRANILPYYQISSPDHPAMPEVARQAIANCKNDAEKYLWYKKAALDWLKANPLQYMKQCGYRTAAMFIDLYREEPIPWWRYPLDLLIGNDQLFLTLLLLCCLLPLWRKQDIWIEIAVLFFIFSTGIYAAVYGLERYLHPAFYVLAPVHGWCLVEVLLPWWKKRQASSS